MITTTDQADATKTSSTTIPSKQETKQAPREVNDDEGEEDKKREILEDFGL